MRTTEKPEKAWVNRVSEIKNLGLQRLVRMYLALLLDYEIDERTSEEVVSRTLSYQDSTFLVCTLPALGKHFELCLELGVWMPYAGIKKRPDSYPVFLGPVFKDIFDRYSLQETPSSDTVHKIRMVRQICYFAYKAQPDDVVSNKTIKGSIAKYFELEDSLPVPAHESGFHINWDPILLGANTLIREIFSDFRWDDLASGHGPGSVSDLEFARKFDSVYHAPHSEGRYSPFYGHDHFTSDMWRIGSGDHNAFIGAGSTSEVLFVPKDSRGPRTICRESTGHMLVQQGLMKYMVNRLENHSLTKGRVNFIDQSVNQTKALISSVTREYSTLDLSDASDRVSVALFEHLFADTELGYAIMVTRSSFARFPHISDPTGVQCVGDNRCKLRKLAPMGSAVCFTTLAVSVWSLLYTALVLSGREDLATRVYIYGDDIVVPTECYSQCIMILENYYLLVNKAKSFSNGWFRESCGMDALAGHDVTPVRLRYFPTQEYLRNPSNKVASFAATVHQLCKRGLYHAARELTSYLPELPPGDVTEPYICLPECMTNSSSKKEYWINKLGKASVQLDGCGRPYVRANCYRVVSDKARVSESMISYYYRTLLPMAGKSLLTYTFSPHGDIVDVSGGRSNGDTQPFGTVSIPRRTLVLRKKTRVYL